MPIAVLERPEADADIAPEAVAAAEVAYDTIDGVLVERTVSAYAGKIAARLIMAVARTPGASEAGDPFTSDSGYAIFDDPARYRFPDFSFIALGRLLPEELLHSFIRIPPDIAAEVVSANDGASQVEAKARAWIAAGAKLVWVVFPETRSVHIYRADGPDEIVGPEATLTAEGILPGFALSVGELLLEMAPVPEAAG